MTGKAWAAFAAVSTLWGIPFLFIKMAVEGGIPPAFLAWGRVVLGAAVLLALCRGNPFATIRRRARWLALFAMAEIALPYLLIALGEQHVDSSLAAILIAAAPLFVALLALRFDARERARGRRLAGLAIGLVGVIALVGVNVAGRAQDLIGAAEILGAAFCYAGGAMIFKCHLADLDPRMSMGASLVLAGVFLAPLAAADPPTRLPSATAIVAIVVLGLLCTAAALVLYGVLIADVGARRALVVTYVNPVVAVALGVAILGEHPGGGAVAGLVLILAGTWLSTDGRLLAPRARSQFHQRPTS